MLAVHQWSDLGSQGVCYIPLGGASHLSCMYQANPGLWDQNVGGGGGGGCGSRDTLALLSRVTCKSTCIIRYCV